MAKKHVISSGRMLKKQVPAHSSIYCTAIGSLVINRSVLASSGHLGISTMAAEAPPIVIPSKNHHVNSPETADTDRRGSDPGLEHSETRTRRINSNTSEPGPGFNNRESGFSFGVGDDAPGAPLGDDRIFGARRTNTGDEIEMGELIRQQNQYRHDVGPSHAKGPSEGPAPNGHLTIADGLHLAARNKTPEPEREPEPEPEPAALPLPWWRRALAFPSSNHRVRYALFAFVMLLFLVAVIVLAVMLHNHLKSTDTSTLVPVVEDYSYGDVLPLADGAMSATDVVIATLYGVASDRPQTKVVYETNDDMICVLTKLQGTWLVNTRCITNINRKPGSALTILDWINGPTIFYVTNDNYLSGLNHVPSNDTWVMSTLVNEKNPVDPQTRLASTTYLDGASEWVYYQKPAPSSQFAEYGLDDYRDTASSWRFGSNGDLGLAVESSFFGATQYTVNGDEREEVYFEASSNSFHGRRYANGVWSQDLFTINGTISGVAVGAAFSVSTLVDPATNASTVLVAYMTTSGWAVVSTRGTGDNVTDLGAFSNPVRVAQNDGTDTASLIIDGSSGVPKLYVVVQTKIMVYIGDRSCTNWTQGVDVLSS
ncbi:hypothetical protein G7Y89_g3421 [Cudoniella acicularis]|uniref:Fucose-specific lectin n=1 Tax=Cudoniella acicularis TaxID=354080 RepID=A0A8H4RRE0_9HELO|nr:hypothetical protein G7Y89_g3421 [Cudoniella acicularis]